VMRVRTVSWVFTQLGGERQTGSGACAGS